MAETAPYPCGHEDDDDEAIRLDEVVECQRCGRELETYVCDGCGQEFLDEHDAREAADELGCAACAREVGHGD